ncbi:MAG: DUF1573 domain-containing protein [Akkermansiaceae bacterium]
MASSTLRKITTGLLALAVICSAYLAWNTIFYKQPILGCSAKSGCNNVLTSPWSLVATVPTLLLGIVAYFSLFCITLRNNNPRDNKFKGALLEKTLAYLIIFAGLWFFSLQAFIIKSYCLWCCTIHSIAIIASISLLSSHFKRKLSPTFLAPLIALIAVSLMALTQVYFPSEVTTYNTSHTGQSNLQLSADTLKIHGDLVSVKTENLPRLTSSSSKNICIVLSDHTCPHCLDFQRNIKKNREVIESNLTIFYLPCFQSIEAREINRLLIIAKRANPAAYESALDAIQNGSLPLNHIEITQFLDKKCNGHFAIYKKSFSPWSYEIMDISSEIMKFNLEEAQVAAFPQTITKSHIIEGVISIQDLIKLSKIQPSSSKDIEDSQPLVNSSPMKSKTSNLIVEKKAYNLGRITKNDIGRDVLNLSNPSKTPLNITKIRTSCGCIDLSHEPFTIAPKSKVKLPFEFHTNKFLGDITHKIFLYDEGASTPISIPITANVWLPFKIFPYSNNLGKIATSTSSGKQKVSFINTTQQPISLDLATQDGHLLNTELNTIVEGVHYELTFEIVNMPAKRLDTTISLKTSHPDCPEIHIPVTAESAPLYELTPTTLTSNIGIIKTDQDATFTLHSYDKSITDPRILKVAFNGKQNDKIAIEILPKNKPSHPPSFKIHFKSGFDHHQATAEKSNVEINSNITQKSIFLNFQSTQSK